MDVVGAAVRIGARALAVAREQVDPALGEGASRARRVFGPERRQRLEDVRLRLVGGVGQVDRRDQRRVEIVVVQLWNGEHPLAQPQVAVERRQVPVHPVDQARVDRRRDVRSRRAPRRARCRTCAPARRRRRSAPARSASLRTSPCIVPSAVKKADITCARSSRTGEARWTLYAALSRRTSVPSLQGDRRVREVRVREDAVDRATGHSREPQRSPAGVPRHRCRYAPGGVECRRDRP